MTWGDEVAAALEAMRWRERVVGPLAELNRLVRGNPPGAFFAGRCC